MSTLPFWLFQFTLSYSDKNIAIYEEANFNNVKDYPHILNMGMLSGCKNFPLNNQWFSCVFFICRNDKFYNAYHNNTNREQKP